MARLVQANMLSWYRRSWYSIPSGLSFIMRHPCLRLEPLVIFLDIVAGEVISVGWRLKHPTCGINIDIAIWQSPLFPILQYILVSRYLTVEFTHYALTLICNVACCSIWFSRLKSNLLLDNFHIHICARNCLFSSEQEDGAELTNVALKFCWLSTIFIISSGPSSS